MSFYDGLLNQAVQWERKTGENEAVESTYASPVTLSAWKEEIQRLVRSSSGVEVPANTLVILADEVFVGDKIDGQVVEARETDVDLGGVTHGWAVFL